MFIFFIPKYGKNIFQDLERSEDGGPHTVAYGCALPPAGGLSNDPLQVYRFLYFPVDGWLAGVHCAMLMVVTTKGGKDVV